MHSESMYNAIRTMSAQFSPNGATRKVTSSIKKGDKNWYLKPVKSVRRWAEMRGSTRTRPQCHSNREFSHSPYHKQVRVSNPIHSLARNSCNTENHDTPMYTVSLKLLLNLVCAEI